MGRWTCMLIVVVFLAFGWPAGAAGDIEAYREAMEGIVADELTPQVEIAARLRGVPFREGEWPEAGVTRVIILADYTTGQSHSMAVDEQAGQVVGYIAPDPVGPVPMDVMPPEQGRLRIDRPAYCPASPQRG